MVILYTAATLPHFITAQLHHSDLSPGSYTPSSQSSRDADAHDDAKSSDKHGTIFLPGNKVTEHPTSGDDGGKFLFEVIPDTVKLLTQTKTRGFEYDYPHAHYKGPVGLLKHITADLTRVSAGIPPLNIHHSLTLTENKNMACYEAANKEV
ncbi:Rho GTPase-activating protein 24 [Collichthys lucidus]|uniref:Rho GTPase-activating protein 24 n=1 Tax=Collichthys lucidus TaxID=240159 RepID=A0A4V6ARG4_COLLU|nr:Rho GTPase-activating protein 24 [Collichthys lucidus]